MNLGWFAKRGIKPGSRLPGRAVLVLEPLHFPSRPPAPDLVARDVVLQLLDDELLLGDDVLDQVAESRSARAACRPPADR